MPTKTRKTPDAFAFDASGSLRTAYLLAISALSHTHVIDQKLIRNLANAVFEAYVDSDCPATPLNNLQIENMAVLSIELMLLHSEAKPLFLQA